MRVEFAFVPDQALIMPHLGCVGQPGLRELRDRRLVHVIFVERGRIGLHCGFDIDIGIAAAGSPRFLTMEAGLAIAVGIDRIMPWPVQAERRPEVARRQDRSLAGLRTAEREQQDGKPGKCATHDLS